MEKWDLYTEDRKLTGKEHVRGVPVPEGLYHLVVHVWIKNAKGQFLMSRRSSSKKRFPLIWESVGGAILKGENSLEGALREVKEEIGVELDPEKGSCIFSEIRKTKNGKIFNDIVDVWQFSYEGDSHLEKTDMGEVQETRWMAVEEIRKLHEQNELVDTLTYFFDRVANENFT